MKARPILFSGPMVRALLEGRKTQTRRVVKARRRDGSVYPAMHELVGEPEIVVCCPYGRPGDLLWVRETLRIFDNRNRPASVEYSAYCGKAGFVEPIDKARAWGEAVLEKRMNRRARAEYQDGRRNSNIQQVSAIHMPRWASRLTLRITDVRVQRLRDICRDDAIAEGTDFHKCPTRQTQTSIDAQAAARSIGMCAHYTAEIDYVGGYQWLWESINGPGSWSANPWVWALTFDVIKANVDQVQP